MSEDEQTALSVDHDYLVNSVAKWIAIQKDNASRAGEMRQSMGEFIDDTGVNKKALSWITALHKMPETKRNDVLRSLDHMRAKMQDHWDGQSELDLSPPGADVAA